MVTGNKTSFTGKENIFGQMAESTVVNGKKI